MALAGGLVLLTGAIMPTTLGAASPPASPAIPDEWSGEWPAQLMEKTGATPLGTLIWREIRYEDGMALVGKDFGGRPFTGCPADGNTRFFRGRYVQGGALIGCTRGADGTELVGRFDGNETFQSSDFTIKITGRDPSFFFGEYVEDDGITVDWCGIRTRIISLPDLPDGSVDYVAPKVSMRSADRQGRRPRPAPLHRARRQPDRPRRPQRDRRRKSPRQHQPAGREGGRLRAHQDVACPRQGTRQEAACLRSGPRPRGQRRRPLVRPAHGGVSHRDLPEPPSSE